MNMNIEKILERISLIIALTILSLGSLALIGILIHEIYSYFIE